LTKRDLRIREHLLIGLALLGLGAMVGRLIYIKSFQGVRLAAKADRQQRADIPIKARRGLILDARGRIISATTLRTSVFADPQVLPDTQVAAETVAGILELDPAEIAPDLLAAGDRRFFVIKRGITEAQAEQIRAAGIYGLGTFSEPFRSYPMEELAAATIGFVSPDGTGISGIEHQCDHWLRGENGVKTIVRDARRKAFWLAEEGYRPARDGYHVVLTIDAEIQTAVESELEAGVSRFNAESGVAVVIHPHTGAVLAMANYPSFDPNHYTDFGEERYRNRVITDPYEPGSTFKPFIAAAALAENVVHPGEVFDCEHGAWTEGARTLKDHHPYDFLSFEEILIKSSNIGMGKLGLRLGNRKLYEYVTKCGFGEPTGVGLEGESEGLLRPLVRWNAFSTTSLPMGQEIGVTPMQLARSFCIFANGGKLVTPYVIRAIVDAEGRVVQDMTPPETESEPVYPPEVLDVMRKILCSVVNDSPRGAAQLPSHQVFGKTGTAQIARKDGRGYEKRAYVSSFVAGVPAENPELVAFVAIRRPDASVGYYGGQVAAPVVKEILRHSLAYLRIPGDIAPDASRATAMHEDFAD